MISTLIGPAARSSSSLALPSLRSPPHPATPHPATPLSSIQQLISQAPLAVAQATPAPKLQPSIRLFPFLPSDAAAAAIASASSAASPALAASAAALCLALSLNDSDFWAWASSESKELGLCLDSYLQFARRPHDGDENEGVKGSSSSSRELSALHRAVLLLLLRLAKGDFPAASGSYSSPYPSPVETSARLLTLPRILDACALYLPTNPSLARSLARRAWKRCHATLPQALDGALPAVAGDLDSVRESLEGKLAARRREKMMAASGGGGGGGGPSSLSSASKYEEIIDGLLLWMDACFSLAALAASHRGAAGSMLEACGGGLVASLAGAHDELLPAVEAAFYQGSLGAAEPTSATEKVRTSFFSFRFFFTLFFRDSNQSHPIIRATGPPLYGLTLYNETNGHERSFSSLCESRDAVRYPSKPKRGNNSFSSFFNRLFGMIPAPHTIFLSPLFHFIRSQVISTTKGRRIERARETNPKKLKQIKRPSSRPQRSCDSLSRTAWAPYSAPRYP